MYLIFFRWITLNCNRNASTPRVLHSGRQLPSNFPGQQQMWRRRCRMLQAFEFPAGRKSRMGKVVRRREVRAFCCLLYIPNTIISFIYSIFVLFILYCCLLECRYHLSVYFAPYVAGGFLSLSLSLLLLFLLLLFYPVSWVKSGRSLCLQFHWELPGKENPPSLTPSMEKITKLTPRKCTLVEKCGLALQIIRFALDLLICIVESKLDINLICNYLYIKMSSYHQIFRLIKPET